MSRTRRQCNSKTQLAQLRKSTNYNLLTLVVPVAENTAVIEKRYEELGGLIRVVHKKDIGHHPHSLKNPTLIVKFILKHAR